MWILSKSTTNMSGPDLRLPNEFYSNELPMSHPSPLTLDTYWRSRLNLLTLLAVKTPGLRSKHVKLLQGIIRRGMDDYHSCSFLEGRFFSVSSGSLVINVDSWRLRLVLWLLIVRHGGVYVIVCTICPHHIIPQCKLIHSNICMYV